MANWRLGPAAGLAMRRCATFVTVARLHPVAAWTADHDIPWHGPDPRIATIFRPANDSGPALVLACRCAVNGRRFTEQVGEPLTRATGLNVAIDLRSASYPIDALVGDLEKETWKFY
jgi:hypothetical protein